MLRVCGPSDIFCYSGHTKNPDNDDDDDVWNGHVTNDVTQPYDITYRNSSCKSSFPEQQAEWMCRHYSKRQRKKQYDH